MKKIKQLDADLNASFSEYCETSEFDRIREKFRKKPYECNQAYKALANVIGFLCGCGSVAMAYVFAAEWITDKIERLPFASVIAVCIAVVCLVVLEVVQRLAINTSIRNYYTGGLQFKNALQAMLSFGITAFSVYLSYMGSFDMVEKLSQEPPQYVAPTLKSTQEVKNRYGSMISEAQKNAESFKKTATWRGKLSIADRRQYTALLSEASKLKQQMNAELLRVEGINDQRTATARAAHREEVTEFKTEINAKGQNLGIITLVLQCIFFVCVGYSNYYDYRVRLQYNDRILGLEKPKTQEPLLARPQMPTVDKLPDTDRMRVVGFTPSKSAHSNSANSLLHNTVRGNKKRDIRADLKATERAIKKRIDTYHKRAEKYHSQGKEKTSANNLATAKYWEYVLQQKLQKEA